MAKVSIVVITKNEEENISECMKSAEWADEIIVVDDESDDKTAEIARGFTDKVFIRKMENEGRHRNQAYEEATGEWILSLDADERVSPELAEEIREVLEKKEDYTGYAIPIRTYIGERWIRYGGWYPAGKLRLFKKGKFRYEESEVHPRIYLDGQSRVLKNDIIHYGYRDLHHFFASLNSQTTLEAEKWFREKRKISFPTLCRKMIDRFLRRFLFKKGYKDGFMGVIIASADSLYQFQSYAKYWEKRNKTNLKTSD